MNGGSASWAGRIGIVLMGGAAACSSSSPATSASDAGVDAPASDATTSDLGVDAGLAETAAEAATDAPADAAPTYDFTALDAFLFGGAWATEGLVVMRHGVVVHEKYAAGWSPTQRHITYSVSKSIGSALVGIAIHQGLLALTDSVCKYITPPTGADPTLCDTTVQDVLQMTSGLTWLENYGTGMSPTSSDILQMVYGNQTDMGSYAASKARSKPAGTFWQYSSGDSNLLARVLRSALGAQDMVEWANANLFLPAGLRSALFETDRSGTLVFSASCFMSPRDMASFGQLYLDDGMKDGVRVLPEGWAAYTQTPASAVSTPTPRSPTQVSSGDTGGSYGAAFWLNSATPTADPSTWLYPSAPVDTFSAEGHYGQKIFIVPSLALVVARAGNDRGDDVMTPTFDSDGMMKAAVAAITAADMAAMGATP